MSLQYASDGILVNTVAPGSIETPRQASNRQRQADVTGASLEEIRQAIAGYDRKKHAVFGYSRRLEADIDSVAQLVKAEYPLSRKSLALLLLQRDEEVTALLQSREGEGYPAIAEKVREKTFERRESFHLDLSMERKGIVR